MSVNGPAVGAVAVGLLFVYAGSKGFSVLKAAQNIVQGKKASDSQTYQAVTIPGTTDVIQGNNVQAVPTSDTSNSQNQALGKQMCAAVGWTRAQWDAFNWIAEDESGWSDTVKNPGSGAAGIAQNIQGFSSAYPFGDANTQIQWMISYIQGRYGTPVAAKAFHVAHGWY